MRVRLECKSQAESRYDDMLITAVHSTWKDSGRMVSAMRELFVSPMKRVRKEITPHIQTRILVIGYLFSLFFFFFS